MTAGNLLTINAAGGADQWAGLITANTLTGTAAGYATFDNTQVANLAAFSTGLFGLIDNGGGLNVTGPVTGTNVAIQTTGAAADSDRHRQRVRDHCRRLVQYRRRHQRERRGKRSCHDAHGDR